MMNTVIQRLLLVTSFLASLSFYYGYVVCAKRHRMAGSPGQHFLPRSPENWDWTSLFLTAAYSGKEDHSLTGGTSRKPSGTAKDVPKNRLSVAGDWLAPALVWFLVISMGLAIVGFLLGER
ncbi:MAG: hypothetical protein WA172_01725 [Terriglobales bacterium]